MPIRHKKEKEKGDIKSYEHDKFTSRSSKGDTTPNTRRIDIIIIEDKNNVYRGGLQVTFTTQRFSYVVVLHTYF